MRLKMQRWSYMMACLFVFVQLTKSEETIGKYRKHLSILSKATNPTTNPCLKSRPFRRNLASQHQTTLEHPSPWLLKALARHPNALLWLRRRGRYILSHPGRFKTEKWSIIQMWTRRMSKDKSPKVKLPICLDSLPNVKFKHPYTFNVH